MIEDDTGRFVTSRRAWLTVGVLLLMYVVSYLDRSILSLMVGPIKHALGIDDFAVSLLQGVAFAVFYALFGLPMGWLVDRFPARNVVFCGVMVWSLCAAACGLARSFVGLACARLGVGAGEATLVPAAYATLSRIFPGQRVAMALAVFSLGSVFGSAAAYLAGGYVISAAEAHGAFSLPLLGVLEPWQQVFLVTSTPGFLIAFLAWAVPDVRRTTGSAAAAPPMPVGPFLRRRKAYLGFGLASMALTAVLAYGTVAWVPTFLMRRHGLPVREVALLMGVASVVGGTAGFLVAGWAADRLFAAGRRDGHLLPIIFALPVLLVASALEFLWVDDMRLFTALLALIMFVLPLVSAFSAHIQITTPPALRGRVSALKITVEQLVGISVGPALVAGLSQFVLRDPAQLGRALFLSYVLVVPVLFVLLLLTRAPARRAIEET